MTAPLDNSNLTHFPLYLSVLSHSIVVKGLPRGGNTKTKLNRMGISFVNEHEENGKTWRRRHTFAWTAADRFSSVGYTAASDHLAEYATREKKKKDRSEVRTVWPPTFD